MNIESLRREYQQRSENYRRLKSEVLYILRQELKSQQIPIHQITGRVKPFSSFIDKARRQESDTPFETISDICGVRVICLFLSDLQRIGEIIESKFVIHMKDDKIYTKPEEAFGYLSVHYVGTLPAYCRGPRYDGLEELKFEIQVRTIAMHSWATVSHYFDYKSPHAIPSHLRKDFHALSALFYLADTRFADLYHSSLEAKETAQEKAQRLPEFGGEEINLDTLVAYMRSRYPDRKQSDSQSISELIEELRAAAYDSVERLDMQLQRSEVAFKEYEKNLPRTMTRYSDVGVVRVSLSIADPIFITHRKRIPNDRIIKTYAMYRRDLL